MRLRTEPLRFSAHSGNAPLAQDIVKKNLGY
jgi:hypothetical protein